MNKLNKIFLTIIVILVIFLIIITTLFFNMRNVAKLNYILYQQATEQVNKLQVECNQNSNNVK